MPNCEVTNNRPSNYSSFRRNTFPNFCFVTDGDWFEQRSLGDKLVTVAYIETIQIPIGSDPVDYPVWDSKVALLNSIRDKMGIPCFVVWHYSSCMVFFVKAWEVSGFIKMYRTEYIDFIKNLKVRT